MRYDTIMNHRSLVFVDIETTGTSPRNSRILEIGAIKVENLEVTDTFNTLLNIDDTIPQFITNLTGITNEMIVSSPYFVDIAETFSNFVNDAIFIAHNVGFDYNFLQMEYRQIGQQFNMDKICTVKLSRNVYPNQQRHNLDTIIKTHGFNVNSRHRALDDAQVLVDLFQKIYANYGIKTFAILDKVLSRSR